MTRKRTRDATSERLEPGLRSLPEPAAQAAQSDLSSSTYLVFSGAGSSWRGAGRFGRDHLEPHFCSPSMDGSCGLFRFASNMSQPYGVRVLVARLKTLQGTRWQVGLRCFFGGVFRSLQRLVRENKPARSRCRFGQIVLARQTVLPLKGSPEQWRSGRGEGKFPPVRSVIRLRGLC